MVAEIDLGSGPCALEVDRDGFAWVTYLRDGHAAKIDPATREEVDRVNTGPGACGVVVAGGALWIADTASNSVARFGLDDGRFIDRRNLDGPPWDLQTLDGDTVWLVNRGSGTVLALDGETGEELLAVDLGARATGLGLTPGAAWVSTESEQTVVHIDAASGEATVIEVDGLPSWLGETGTAVWVGLATAAEVVRIDAATREIDLRAEVGAEPLDLTVAFGRVWVPNHADGTLSVVDEATGAPVDTIPLKRGVWVAEPVGKEVWVTDFSARKIFVIDPALVGA